MLGLECAPNKTRACRLRAVRCCEVGRPPEPLRKAAREDRVELGADQGDRGFAGEGDGEVAGPEALAGGAATQRRRAAEGGRRVDGAEADLAVGGEARAGADRVGEAEEADPADRAVAFGDVAGLALPPGDE